MKALRRPNRAPILPPVIMSDAITRVNMVMAVCTPDTVVWTSAATWLIDTFMTLESSVMRNCAAAKIGRTPVTTVRAAGFCGVLTEQL